MIPPNSDRAHQPLPEGLYDFDANGPVLDDDDEAILDRIWARIAAKQHTQADDTETQDRRPCGTNAGIAIAG